MLDRTTQLTNLNPDILDFQNQLRTQYAIENQTVKSGQIDFIGSSLMEIFPIKKMQLEGNLNLDKIIYNRGVRATTTADLLAHMNTLIFDLNPSKIFMNIGSNDVGFGVSEEEMVANYANICQQIATRLPNCKVYVMAYYPVNTKAQFGNSDNEHTSLFHVRTNASLQAASNLVAKIAKKYGFMPINVNQGLTDMQGNLKPKPTFDGAHLLPEGYQIVLNNLMPYLKTTRLN